MIACVEQVTFAKLTLYTGALTLKGYTIDEETKIA